MKPKTKKQDHYYELLKKFNTLHTGEKADIYAIPRKNTRAMEILKSGGHFPFEYNKHNTTSNELVKQRIASEITQQQYYKNKTQEDAARKALDFINKNPSKGREALNLMERPRRR